MPVRFTIGLPFCAGVDADAEAEVADPGVAATSRPNTALRAPRVQRRIHAREQGF